MQEEEVSVFFCFSAASGNEFQAGTDLISKLVMNAGEEEFPRQGIRALVAQAWEKAQ